ncbi:MAG: sn-glycerol-3-phosphate ABC transporter ATP-binding protein UgpC [Candidatus Wallbacteria bacterium]
MAQVLLEKVTKKYEGNSEYTIFPTDLTIRDKEFMVMVGPSGCGKTTTLRMIAGLEEISEGKIFIGDTLVNDLQPKDRDIAMVFQNYALYPHMNIFENMAFGLRLRNFSEDEIKKRVEYAGKILDLTTYLDKKPKQLSGGQRQRVALGRAIVRNPKVFLMDEPLSNLDAKLRVAMRSEIRRIHKSQDATTIYVTHDQTEAMTMGDRIAIFYKGVIQQVDEPQKVYDNPANKFVAGFIGSPAMNFVKCRVQNNGGSLYTISGLNNEFTVSKFEDKKNALGSYNNQTMILGIRPEAIELVTEKTTENCINVTADIVELLGNERYIHFKLGEDTVVARFKSNCGIHEGDKFAVRFVLEKIHLFDAGTEKTII